MNLYDNISSYDIYLYFSPKEITNAITNNQILSYTNIIVNIKNLEFVFNNQRFSLNLKDNDNFIILHDDELKKVLDDNNNNVILTITFTISGFYKEKNSDFITHNNNSYSGKVVKLNNNTYTSLLFCLPQINHKGTCSEGSSIPFDFSFKNSQEDLTLYLDFNSQNKIQSPLTFNSQENINKDYDYETIYVNLYNFLKDLHEKIKLRRISQLSEEQIKSLNEIFNSKEDREIFSFNFVFYNITGKFVAIYPKSLESFDSIRLYYILDDNFIKNFKDSALSLSINKRQTGFNYLQTRNYNVKKLIIPGQFSYESNKVYQQTESLILLGKALLCKLGVTGAYIQDGSSVYCDKNAEITLWQYRLLTGKKSIYAKYFDNDADPSKLSTMKVNEIIAHYQRYLELLLLIKTKQENFEIVNLRNFEGIMSLSNLSVYLREKLVELKDSDILILEKILAIMQPYEDYILKDFIKSLYKNCKDYDKFLMILYDIYNIPFKILSNSQMIGYSDFYIEYSIQAELFQHLSTDKVCEFNKV